MMCNISMFFSIYRAYVIEKLDIFWEEREKENINPLYTRIISKKDGKVAPARGAGCGCAPGNPDAYSGSIIKRSPTIDNSYHARGETGSGSILVRLRAFCGGAA